jgi:hypothetical protein
MEKYRASMSAFNLGTCTVCKEQWPTRAANAQSQEYICAQCTKDPVKYSAQNDMDPCFDQIPDNIRKMLAECTLVEEMLLSPIFPVMKVDLLKINRARLSASRMGG